MQPNEPEPHLHGQNDPAPQSPIPQQRTPQTVRAEGVNGRYIALHPGDFIEIAGGARVGAHGATVRVHVSEVTGVELRPATALANGALRVLMGGVPGVRERPGHRNTDARKDAYTVVFRRKHQSDMNRMRDAIEGAQVRYRPGG